METFGLSKAGELKVILKRVVEFKGKSIVDGKIEGREMGWEIIGLIQVKQVKGLNRGSGSGDIFEND